MTPKEILKRLFQYARPYAGYLIGGLLCAVASIALTLLGPVSYTHLTLPTIA